MDTKARIFSGVHSKYYSHSFMLYTWDRYRYSVVSANVVDNKGMI